MGRCSRSDRLSGLLPLQRRLLRSRPIRLRHLRAGGSACRGGHEPLSTGPAIRLSAVRRAFDGAFRSREPSPPMACMDRARDRRPTRRCRRVRGEPRFASERLAVPAATRLLCVQRSLHRLLADEPRALSRTDRHLRVLDARAGDARCSPGARARTIGVDRCCSAHQGVAARLRAVTAATGCTPPAWRDRAAGRGRCRDAALCVDRVGPFGRTRIPRERLRCTFTAHRQRLGLGGAQVALLTERARTSDVRLRAARAPRMGDPGAVGRRPARRSTQDGGRSSAVHLERHLLRHPVATRSASSVCDLGPAFVVDVGRQPVDGGCEPVGRAGDRSRGRLVALAVEGVAVLRLLAGNLLGPLLRAFLRRHDRLHGVGHRSQSRDAASDASRRLNFRRQRGRGCSPPASPTFAVPVEPRSPSSGSG